jgi:acyl carrier protein
MENKVKEIISEIKAAKGLDPMSSINAETRLREDLGFTSFDLAELTVKIEDEFDIDIFEDGLVSSVGEIFAKLEA